MAGVELKGVWRDGPYLIAHHRLAQFPQRCIVCGDSEECRPLSCKIRRRPGLLPLLIWWTGVFSPAVIIKPYVCADHRRRELMWRWFGRVIVVVGITMLVVPTYFVATRKPLLSEREDVHLVMIGLILVWIWVYYRIFRRRIIYAKYIKKRDAWIEGVHPSVLYQVPLLSDPSES
jgi:hypothetical protein